MHLNTLMYEDRVIKRESGRRRGSLMHEESAVCINGLPI